MEGRERGEAREGDRKRRGELWQVERGKEGMRGMASRRQGWGGTTEDDVAE